MGEISYHHPTRKDIISYHHPTRKVIMITHYKYQATPSVKGTHKTSFPKQLIFFFQQERTDLGIGEAAGDPHQSFLFLVFTEEFDVQNQRTEPTNSTSSSLVSIEKALYIYICQIIHRLYNVFNSLINGKIHHYNHRGGYNYCRVGATPLKFFSK